MPKNERENDISIGKDQWIAFGDLEGKQSEAVDIDDAVDICSELWAALETECVAGCCGIDAFALWQDDIQNAARSLGKDATVSNLLRMKDLVTGIDAVLLVSTRLNNYFRKPVLQQIIDHMLHCANGA